MALLHQGQEESPAQGERQAIAPASERYSHRPGGWLVGAAHAGIDAYRLTLAAKQAEPSGVNELV